VTSDQLRRLVQSGRGDQEDVASHQTATSALTKATGDRQSALEDWFDAGTASLAAAQVATLKTLRGNRQWKLEIEFLAADRPQAEWVKLRNALSHERISAKYGEAVDPSVQSYLASARSNPAVSTAVTYSNTNLAAVEAGWNSAVK
jgi:hypothetical protein